MGVIDNFTIDSYIFDARPAYPFFITAKRYVPSTSHHISDSDSGGHNPNDKNDSITSIYTLIMAHCTGGHKEQWEPTISELSKVVRERENAIRLGVRIREIWSIDCANHGDAAILNEYTLRWGYDVVYPWEDYGRAIHLLLTGRGKGIPPNYFRGHNLVGIGHSMGAVAIMLSQTYPDPPIWTSMILVEPMIIPIKDEGKFNFLEQAAMSRRDIWSSHQAAFDICSKRKAFESWDTRVLKLFCEDGLRDLPTSEYPDKKDGVTLKCARLQEAACYRDKIGRIRAYHYLPHTCDLQPVHIIYGAIDDYTAGSVKQDIIENASQGKLASVQRVNGAGHLIVQTGPGRLANAIFNVLKQNNTLGKGTNIRADRSRL